MYNLHCRFCPWRCLVDLVSVVPKQVLYLNICFRVDDDAIIIWILWGSVNFCNTNKTTEPAMHITMAPNTSWNRISYHIKIYMIDCSHTSIKVEKILKGSLDSIPSPCVRYKLSNRSIDRGCVKGLVVVPLLMIKFNLNWLDSAHSFKSIYQIIRSAFSHLWIWD